MATDDRLNGRQLHIEDYLRMIPAEQGKKAGVPDYRRIADDDSISRYFQPDNLMEIILRTDNLNKACLKVKKNKGKGGIDGMQVDELLPYLRENQSILAQQLRDGKYKPNPVRRVEIPKEEKGKVRKLGIPTQGGERQSQETWNTDGGGSCDSTGDCTGTHANIREAVLG